jgi:hypothetical protein
MVWGIGGLLAQEMRTSRATSRQNRYVLGGIGDGDGDGGRDVNCGVEGGVDAGRQLRRFMAVFSCVATATSVREAPMSRSVMATLEMGCDDFARPAL